jgi:hypothetical protein
MCEFDEGPLVGGASRSSTSRMTTRTRSPTKRPEAVGDMSGGRPAAPAHLRAEPAIRTWEPAGASRTHVERLSRPRAQCVRSGTASDGLPASARRRAGTPPTGTEHSPRTVGGFRRRLSCESGSGSAPQRVYGDPGAARRLAHRWQYPDHPDSVTVVALENATAISSRGGSGRCGWCCRQRTRRRTGRR